ncbi:MAG: hypothetical protein IT449_12190 [Phycisphaerales bacterium]|nr:hypothetical protein [Phycisphaerales bacterium]
MELGAVTCTAEQREQRLHKLIDLALHYRGWSKKQLADALDRHVTKLYPEGGNPKLDFVIGLAQILEWPIEAVVDFIWFDDSEIEPSDDEAAFEALDAVAMEAFRAADYRRMLEISQRAFVAALTAEQRALACQRQAGAWDLLGQSHKSLEMLRKGLRQVPLSDSLRLMLESNLAYELLVQGEITEARGIAQLVLDWYTEHPPTGRRDVGTQGFAYYVRGHISLRMLQFPLEDALPYAESARADLQSASDIFSRLHTEFGDEQTSSIAHTCHGGLLEAEVALGQRSAQDVVSQIMTKLDEADALPVGDMLESHGWWCIFGANLALRHLQGREQQRAIAVLTNKGLEIANRLNNWVIRERVLNMEYKVHLALKDRANYDLDYVIDEEDLRLITGAVGQFPLFRRLGWQIIRTARVVDSK